MKSSEDELVVVNFFPLHSISSRSRVKAKAAAYSSSIPSSSSPSTNYSNVPLLGLSMAAIALGIQLFVTLIFNVDMIKAILTRNVVVASVFWAQVWFFLCIVVKDNMNYAKWYEILGGPITILVGLSPDIQLFSLLMFTSFISYALSLCFIQNDQVFTLLIYMATYTLIFALCIAIKSHKNVQRSVRAGKESSHHRMSYLLSFLDGFFSVITSTREEIKADRINADNFTLDQ